MACGAAWARICVASLHNPALRTVIDAKATNLASTWRGILAETSPDRVSSGCVNIVLTDQGQEDGQAFLLDVEVCIYSRTRPRPTVTLIDHALPNSGFVVDFSPGYSFSKLGLLCLRLHQNSMF